VDGDLLQMLNPGRRTFELCGDLDMTTSPDLLGAVAPVLCEPGDITLDLKQLSFMDSSGVGAMLKIAGSLAGGSLFLAESHGIVKRILELSVIDGRGGIRVLSNGASSNGRPVASGNEHAIVEPASPRDGGPCPTCSLPRVAVTIDVAGHSSSATLCGRCGARIGARVLA
jgi:anti-anti-sigma factor